MLKCSKSRFLARACLQVLNANGVSKLQAEVGQKLDPNQHEAVFDVPNPDAEPGTIAIIVKVGILPAGFSLVELHSKASALEWVLCPIVIDALAQNHFSKVFQQIEVLRLVCSLGTC